MAFFEMTTPLDLQSATKIVQSPSTSNGSDVSVGSSDQNDASSHERLDSAPEAKAASRAKKAAKHREKKKGICLDYLKGKCLDERYYCKYVHAQVHKFHPTLGVKVCQPYVLTGTCKFGESCYGYHPLEDDPNFNISHRRRGQPIVRPDSLTAEGGGSTKTPQPDSLQTALQRVNSILNSLPSSKESAIVQAIVRMISNNPRLTMNHLLSLVFFKVTDAKGDTYALYGSLCKSLCMFSDEPLQQLADVIVRRVMKLTELLPVDASPELQAEISRRQMCCVIFWEERSARLGSGQG